MQDISACHAVLLIVYKKIDLLFSRPIFTDNTMHKTENRRVLSGAPVSGLSLTGEFLQEESIIKGDCWHGSGGDPCRKKKNMKRVRGGIVIKE